MFFPAMFRINALNFFTFHRTWILHNWICFYIIIFDTFVLAYHMLRSTCPKLIWYLELVFSFVNIVSSLHIVWNGKYFCGHAKQLLIKKIHYFTCVSFSTTKLIYQYKPKTMRDSKCTSSLIFILQFTQRFLPR